MALILDTSVIIALEREDKPVLSRLSELSKVHMGAPHISIISYYEFIFGVSGRTIKNQEKAVGIINKMICVPMTKQTAEIMSELRQKHQKLGIDLQLADLIVASHAKEKGMTLATMDKIFQKIEGISKIIL
jgi:predicted nucleic acid-binding protein